MNSQAKLVLKLELNKFSVNPWKNLYKHKGLKKKKYNLIKTLYLFCEILVEWRWDKTSIPSNLTLSNDDLTVKRFSNEGINPLVQTSNYDNFFKNCEILIVHF